MRQAEQDLGTKLGWVGVYLVICGDQGCIANAALSAFTDSRLDGVRRLECGLFAAIRFRTEN